MVAFAPTGMAQVSKEEHLKHHPELAKDGKGDEATKEEGKGPGGMMGGMMGDMGKMMEQMGAPKDRELYPELMRLPDLPPEKRAEVQAKAHERMKSGAALLATGVKELSDAAPGDDFAAMQTATHKVREGLAEFDSGLAAHRALAEGGEPRNVALQWFRKEMNLAGGADFPTRPQGVFGMSTFHFFSMALLIAFAVAMFVMYFFKMRRASGLLEQLASDAGKASSAVVEPPAPQAAALNPGNPAPQIVP
ncbi:MAG: oxidoreductase, partial [Akkermansiaceae bacterium]|nr:oxidoreductase [Akkermansiaceae bacterium]